MTKIQLQAQDQLAKRALELEVEKLDRMQKAERSHQAIAQQLELQHSKSMAIQRLEAREREDTLAGKALERRLLLEKGHQAQLAEIQVGLLKQQMEVARLANAQQKQVGWRASEEAVD
jgi:hypothetical protein